MATEERKARAVKEAVAYQQRLAKGTAEPREEFLAKHEDLCDLLEPMLEESRAVTASVPLAQGVSPRSTSKVEVPKALGSAYL